MFTGPKGTGKTSAARLVAKAINCLRPDSSGEPCGKCEACESINNNNALDLIEIDAASNRGIDDIRSLRETINLSPVKYQYKVYIIDEVHMLTTEAFNALLKTLEEPPAHVVFVLCTTDAQKVPETIESRCLKFNFRKGTTSEVILCLERAVRGEKLKVEEGVMAEIAKRVDGSFRDAHKLLEQAAGGQTEIVLKDVKQIFGTDDSLLPATFIVYLCKKDTQGALAEIGRVVANGADLGNYLQLILEHLRVVLLFKVGATKEVPLEPLTQLNLEQIKRLIGLFMRAAGEIKSNPIPQLSLELVTVEWCLENTQCKQQDTSNKMQNEEKLPEKQEEVAPKSVELKQVEEKWGELLAGVRPENHSVEALLRAARPLEIAGDDLTLEIFYKFHKERLETAKIRAIVEGVASKILGREIKLHCVLGEKKPEIKKNDESGIIDLAEDIFKGKVV